MSGPLESFIQYVISESYKGPEQIKLGSFSYSKPDTFSKIFTEGRVSTYDEPEFIERKFPRVSPEEYSELRSLGLLEDSKIDHISVKKFRFTYDIIVMWTETGADNIIFIPKSAKMEFEVSVWNEETDTDESQLITVVDDDIGDRFEWDSWNGPMVPIEPTSVDIFMNKSFDPKQFRYDFMLGEYDR